MTVFRAYDVRGVYGTELTEEIAARMGASFGSYCNGGIVTLGRDPRVSGPFVERAFLDGVLNTGCDVESYGILPISVISFVTMAWKRRAAAYISASHNPPEYNGIRFRTGDGYGLLYHQTKIMDYYESGNFITGEGRVSYRDPLDAVKAYGTYVSGRITLKGRLKVVLDTGNGSACVMPPLYEGMGIDSVVLNGEPDGTFPGRGPAPNEASLEEASKVVVSEGADYGVGFDPDADRGIIIDDLGRVLPPEKVAIILAKRRYGPGDLLISGFDCSMILEKELEPVGIRVERERVGDVYVANRVKDSGAVLGVERSGHFFLPEFQYSDDPFSMSLALGEILSEGARLSELADGIPDYPYVQKSISIEGDPAVVMANLRVSLSPMNPDTTDGLKVTTKGYSVLIRPSNTEPLIRLYVETVGDDQDDLVQRFEEIVRAAMG